MLRWLTQIIALKCLHQPQCRLSGFSTDDFSIKASGAEEKVITSAEADVCADVGVSG